MPVPVFAAVGAGAWGPVQELRAVSTLRLVDTPRHAAVLLVAGRIPAAHAEALSRVHDQLPHPRAVVAWSGAAGNRWADLTVEGGAEEMAEAVVDAFARVMEDPALSSPDRLPDEEPNEWRGVGPFGQGGEGMMGGTPYGRPMAMTGDDRDGLALDQLHLVLGPFLSWLPPGMTLDMTLQGDVVHSATAQMAPPTADDAGAPLADEGADRPGRAGLRRLAHGLHVHGLDALAARAARLAAAPADHRSQYLRLRRAVRRSGLLWSIRGVARIDGLGDAAQRWEARLEAIGEELASGRRAAAPQVRFAWAELGRLVRGMTLTDAVTTVVSLQDRFLVPHEDLAGR